jgi:hypothetical protein
MELSIFNNSLVANTPWLSNFNEVQKKGPLSINGIFHPKMLKNGVYTEGSFGVGKNLKQTPIFTEETTSLH